MNVMRLGGGGEQEHAMGSPTPAHLMFYATVPVTDYIEFYTQPATCRHNNGKIKSGTCTY